MTNFIPMDYPHCIDLNDPWHPYSVVYDQITYVIEFNTRVRVRQSTWDNIWVAVRGPLYENLWPNVGLVELVG
ncbi:hypothetical protein LCGC14_1541590 [marine sediment metagenome]|uniref:Uncharacterized protein n=1 Tax=marine sediment metagenome TaxID=412755 RepID=A0A0F9ISX0_9ZZZZ